jgi:hypothetical protein
MDRLNSDDKIWVTISRTIKLANYNNLRIEAGLSRTLLPKENPYALIEVVSDEIFATLKKKGKEYKKVLKPKKSIKPNKYEMDLPDSV